MEDEKGIRLSVIICTFRNPDFLNRAICSLFNQTLVPDQYEIIVVDNNSQDQTPNVVQQLAVEAKPAIHYIFEKRQGLSFARNTGIEAAHGDIVVFLDDDAEAEADWLSVLLEAYDSNPDIWAVGGKLLPIWHVAKRPDWLTDKLVAWLSLLDYGDESRPLVWPERILGANFSFRKRIFPIVGYFDTQLGRKGKALLGNEDTEIQERIHKNKKFVYYKSNAIVHHHVPPERTTERYFFRRQFGSARSQTILQIRKDGYKQAIGQVFSNIKLLLHRVWMITKTCTLSRRSTIPFDHKRMLFLYLGRIAGFIDSLLWYHKR
jgi:glucosyl-dolichyl phosphate glucuronosyltransferase